MEAEPVSERVTLLLACREAVAGTRRLAPVDRATADNGAADGGATA